jgi:23S rRNA pseudouridine1911/1915/1917 synthase
MNLEIEIDEQHLDQRIDSVVAQKMEGKISRSQLQKLFKKGQVLLNSKVIYDCATKIKNKSVVKIENNCEIQERLPIAENIPIEIIYEDEYIIIINKAAGMVCHPATSHRSGTLVNALLWHCGSQLLSSENQQRPGIIHRLDKDTSGLMIVAKSNEVHRLLASYFAEGKGTAITREYKCFVFGAPKEMTIKTLITRDTKNRQQYMVSELRGKEAITLCKTLKTMYITTTKAISLVKCKLLTGRTHQIRVHMKHIGCPIVGDQVYKKNKIENSYPEIIKNFNRTALHSYKISFIHPITKEHLRFEIDLPDDLQKLHKLSL